MSLAPNLDRRDQSARDSSRLNRKLVGQWLMFPIAVVLAATFEIVRSEPASAATRNWIGGEGNWNDAKKWDTARTRNRNLNCRLTLVGQRDLLSTTTLIL